MLPTEVVEDPAAAVVGGVSAGAGAGASASDSAAAASLADADADPKDPLSVTKNAAPKMIFGTVNGSLGVILSLSSSLFNFLRRLQAAVKTYGLVGRGGVCVGGGGGVRGVIRTCLANVVLVSGVVGHAGLCEASVASTTASGALSTTQSSCQRRHLTATCRAGVSLTAT